SGTTLATQERTALPGPSRRPDGGGPRQVVTRHTAPQALSSQLLAAIADPMRKQEVRTGGEAGQGRGPGSPAGQVKALVDLLAGKSSQGSQAPEPLDRVPQAPLGPHGDGRRKEGVPGPSRSPLPSLLLLEGLTDLQLREHDFTQVETTRGAWRPARSLTLDRLFLPLSRVSIPPRISITIGVAGVGKTTLVRNFVQLWARGQVAKDFSLVLPLTFRDLNTHEKLSADRLVRSVFSHIGESGLAAPAPPKTLLILDGLDECKTPLDFSNTVACTDPKKEIQVDHLITNIIRGNLFPEVSVWVTSRPSVAGQIPGGLVDRMTEIRGFDEEEIKACLEEMFPEDHTLSDWVLRQVRADRALYLMCTVPAFCRIAGSALGHLRHSGPGPQDAGQQTPRTLCELYSWYFRMALGGDGQEKGKVSPRIEQVAHSCRKMVGTLGRARDLRALGGDPALLQRGLASRFLQREETLAASTAYCFTHLSLQEFVAAAYYYAASRRAIFDLFAEGGVSWPRLGFLTHFRGAAPLPASLARAVPWQSSARRRITPIRVVPRAPPPCHWRPFAGASFHPPAGGGTTHYRSAACRLDNNQFQDPVMELLGSVLSGKDCRIQRISLAENQISNKGAKALARSLLVNRSLTALDLRSNSIGPQGAKALADALKINRTLAFLSLQNNAIRDNGARFVAEALAANRTLSVLHLQKNTIGPLGAQQTADALKQNRSLKELIFSSNSIGDKGAEALAKALKVNQGLESLDLQSNSISDAGVAALMGALCTNQTLISLNLRENSISSEGARDLAQALCSNSTLKNLDLTANLLHDQGAQAIALAVRENRALTSLHLQWNFIQAGAAKALGQALQFNQSLTSLDLQENAIGDEGASALASALKANTALTALYLQVASIGARGAQALGDALAVNRTLEILDLRGNAIGVAGAKALANALKVNSSLRRLNLQENSLGMDGAICVATALSGNHGLQHINLQGNHIGESGARMISEAIKTNAPSCTVEM
uniref:NLR family CARD domain containing 3 n=1 Tax=Panthera tigris altaica TaxID=74533 RepID=A0A8C9KHA3_PANTA